MASIYLDLHYHIVFATKLRRNTIREEWRHDLHAYLAGTLRELGGTPIEIGGTTDHVHILTGLRATHALADIVREVKKSSSSWAKTERQCREFGWQEGYAAFTVGASSRPPIVEYIRGQVEHHRKLSSAEELEWMLKEAGVEYDRKYFE